MAVGQLHKRPSPAHTASSAHAGHRDRQDSAASHGRRRLSLLAQCTRSAAGGADARQCREFRDYMHQYLTPMPQPLPQLARTSMSAARYSPRINSASSGRAAAGGADEHRAALKARQLAWSNRVGVKRCQVSVVVGEGRGR